MDLRPFTFRASVFLSWSVWLVYIIIQFHVVIALQLACPRFVWQIWVILGAGLLLSSQDVGIAVNFIFCLTYAPSDKLRPRYSLHGDSAPRVDIFVTCCGESVDVILDTINAAIAQDYPPTAFRVLVLDDGHDCELRSRISSLSRKSAGEGGPKVHYLERQVEPGIRSFFKSGNLQFGINESERMGSSDFFAALDADMIPARDWLRRTVPHLLMNNDTAIVCIPQVRVSSIYHSQR